MKAFLETLESTNTLTLTTLTLKNPRSQVAHNYQRQDALFHRILHQPVALAAVSEAVHAILSQQVPP